MLNYCRYWIPGWTGSKVDLISKLIYGIYCLEAKDILQTLPLLLCCFNFSFLLLRLEQNIVFSLKLNYKFCFRVKAHRYAIIFTSLILETSGSHLFVMIYLRRNRVEMVLAMGIQVFSELNTEVIQVFKL